MEKAVKVPIVDPLDDPNTKNDPFFAEAEWCLVVQKPNRLLHVRDQGNTNVCYAFVVTTCMFGDEVNARGHSTQGSTQEYLDYIHLYKRPESIQSPVGPFKVEQYGFMNTYGTAFGYAINHGVSPESLYAWVGECKFDTCDGRVWDGKVENRQRQIITREQKISIQGYERILGSKAIEEQLKKQPLAGAIGVTRSFMKWRSGEVYKQEDISGDPIGRHAITIVGYGGEGEKSYYICQNSYGLKWGYKGYFRVRRYLVSGAYIPVDTCSPGGKYKMKLTR